MGWFRLPLHETQIQVEVRKVWGVERFQFPDPSHQVIHGRILHLPLRWELFWAFGKGEKMRLGERLRVKRELAKVRRRGRKQG